jgi:proline iminopeptidase
MKNAWLPILVLLTVLGCRQPSEETSNASNGYLDYSGTDTKLSGGSRMIPIKTEYGEFKVWTKRVGNNPKLKVLLLHGGPGATSEYFEAADSYFPAAGIEYYYYDQLGSARSDNPKDERLWNVDRFVDEVEQVRKALGLDSGNFVLLGHSWGGILGMEYALKHQKNLKGLIISNMVASIPEYVKYANEVLGPKLPADVLKKIRDFEAKKDYTNPEYLGLIQEHYYPQHVIRMKPGEWPDPVNRGMGKVNYPLYLKMQGPSEFGVVGDAVLKDWDRTADLPKITVPTLTIGGQHDTMDPNAMKRMSESVKNGQYLYCPNGSHFSMYDDQETYFKGVIAFLKKL